MATRRRDSSRRASSSSSSSDEEDNGARVEEGDEGSGSDSDEVDTQSGAKQWGGAPPNVVHDTVAECADYGVYICDMRDRGTHARIMHALIGITRPDEAWPTPLSGPQRHSKINPHRGAKDHSSRRWDQSQQPSAGGCATNEQSGRRHHTPPWQHNEKTKASGPQSWVRQSSS